MVCGRGSLTCTYTESLVLSIYFTCRWRTRLIAGKETRSSKRWHTCFNRDSSIIPGDSISAPIKTTIPFRSFHYAEYILPVRQGNRFNALPVKNCAAGIIVRGFQLTGMKFHYATCTFRRYASRRNKNRLCGSASKVPVTSSCYARFTKIIRFEIRFYVHRRSSWSSWTPDEF